MLTKLLLVTYLLGKPQKFRFIIVSPISSLNSLSKSITYALSVMNKQAESYKNKDCFWNFFYNESIISITKHCTKERRQTKNNT